MSKAVSFSMNSSTNCVEELCYTMMHFSPCKIISAIYSKIIFVLIFIKYIVKDSILFVWNLCFQIPQLEINELMPEVSVKGKTIEVDWCYMKISASPVPKDHDGKEPHVKEPRKTVWEKMKRNADFAIRMLEFALTPIAKILRKIKTESQQQQQPIVCREEK